MINSIEEVGEGSGYGHTDQSPPGEVYRTNYQVHDILPPGEVYRTNYQVHDHEQLEPSETQSRPKWKVYRDFVWNNTFAISSVIAVSMDPLFFYIPFIDEEKKCLGVDKSLRSVALTSRGFTDIYLLVHIICQVYDAINDEASDSMSMEQERVLCEHAYAVAKKLSHRYFITNILSVIPLPQVLIGAVFFKMRGSSYLDNRKLLNAFLLAQYLPRMYRVYLSTKRVRYTSTKILLRGGFNFYMYILASHILGASWYFFSIQRETSCWYRACKRTAGCITPTYYCDDDPASINITLLSNLCPTEPTNATIFDFGIFSDSLQSGNTGPIRFTTKLFYSFWWGLRNISSFGTSLMTSSDDWENCFAIFISLTGLLLFCYLIGNVEACMKAWDEERKRLLEKMQNFRVHNQNIVHWMNRNNLPAELRKEIMTNIREKLEQDKDTDQDNLFYFLSWRTKKSLKRYLCMNRLRRIERLSGMEEKVLKMICDYLKPVIYGEGGISILNEKIDHLILITAGSITIYSGRTENEYYDIYGEELLDWATWASENNLQNASILRTLPNLNGYAGTNHGIEGFAITAKDLKTVFSKCNRSWNTNTNPHHNEYQEERTEGVHRVRGLSSVSDTQVSDDSQESNRLSGRIP